jgi:hypothetical protein
MRKIQRDGRSVSGQPRLDRENPHQATIGTVSEPRAQPYTPFCDAIHAQRHWRQDLIRQIEKLTDRRLLVYFTDVEACAGIEAGDVAPFQDLLLDCEPGCKLDLLLQTPGGDVDVPKSSFVWCGSERVSFAWSSPSEPRALARSSLWPPMRL